MKSALVLSLVVLGFMALGVQPAVCGTPEPTDPGKQTTLQKYTDSKDAYTKWSADKDNVKIVDTRTTEEYVYVGHAPMAYSVPYQIWTGKWDPEKRDVSLALNPDFVSQLRKILKPTDTVLVMCRSGQRSAKAVDILAKEGFSNVFNVIDGFEGDKVQDEESFFRGKRNRNGWKNSGAPWTYEVKPELVPGLTQ
jgi:rhodanese-related sulfurtransferase